MPRAVSLLALLVLAAPSTTADPPKAAAPPAGVWAGKLKVGVIELTLAFDVSADKDGKLTAKFYSLDQTPEPLPVKEATFADGKLTMDLPALRAKYEGTLGETGDAIKGTFTQNGAGFELNLTAVKELPRGKRPQTPKAPFPYPTEDVAFENAGAKVTLAGTLTLPKGDGPFPAVVLVSGSGPQDRDETMFGHKPFLVIADHFARHGIACLRYDDRGVGKSTGAFAGATSADFAADAAAAVHYLKTRKEVDPKRIGVCGHSEGGLIAPLVAVAHPKDVGFIILLAGPGVSGERILHRQQVDFAKQLDPTADEKELAAMVDGMLGLLRSDRSADEVRAGAKKLFADLIGKETDEKKRKAAEEAVPAAAERLADPWLRWFVAHDPAPVLKKVTCPVLAVNGEKDIQVHAKDNLGAIEAALKAGGNTRFECVEFAGLNHLFQTCETGAISEYGRIEETLAPPVLTKLTGWVKGQK